MPVFVPDPEDFQLEDFIERLAFDLAERYRDVEDELIRELAARIYRDIQLQQLDPGLIVPGGLTAAQRREQNRILALLADHRARSIRELQYLAVQLVEKLRPQEVAEALVRTAAEEGESAAAARLGLARRLPVEQIPLSFIGGGATGIAATTLNASATQAVGALVLSLQSRLEALNERITRYPQDMYQRIVSLTAPRTLLGATTSLRQQQATVQQFLSKGITGFVDRSGRQWRLGSYAEMAGRTAVNRAFNDASVWRMQQSGINLVVIVGGFDACKRCAPWIGKLLSSDGSAPGPRIVQHATDDRMVGVQVAGTLDGARAAGWNHPNCRCRPVAYLPGLSVPQGNFEYDAQAERDRIRHRELERNVRQSKRDLAAAPNDIAKRQAERDIAEGQAAIREHLRITGQNRQSYREQVSFSSTIGATPERPPSTKAPKGGPNINIDAGTQLGKDVRSARSAIAKVHSIPSSLPPLDVRSARLRVHENGVYRGPQSLLQMNPAGVSPKLTFAHEIGHYLDHTLLGTATTNFESRMLSDPLTKAWLDAVQQSPSFRALRTEAFAAELRSHVDYLVQPVELWGRSYAQYIATRAGDADMLASIAAYRESPDRWTALRQWDTTEFAPIADAIDAILRSKGVLK